MAKSAHTRTDAATANRFHIRWKPETYWLSAILSLLAIFLISTASGGWIVGAPLSREGSLMILLLCAHISILLLVMHAVSILMLTHISTNLFTSWAYRKRLRDAWTWIPAAMFLSGSVWPLAVMAHSGQAIWPWWWTEWAIGIAIANLLLIIPLIQALMRSVTPKYYLKSLVGWETITEADLKSELSGRQEEIWRLVLHDMMQRSITEGRLLVLKEILNALEKRAAKLLLLACPEDSPALAESLCVPFAAAIRIGKKAQSSLSLEVIQATLHAISSYCAGKGMAGAAKAFFLCAETSHD